MDRPDWMLEQFEAHRSHLRAVAYRMLGSLSEADDAVQVAWMRFSRDDRSDVENVGGFLTTVVSRVCLNVLRSRGTRKEEPLDSHLPDPIVTPEDHVDPEHEALLADAVGLALHVVLDRLAPAERLAFVLHDMFGVPFNDIAEILDRTPDAARQLASRGRRRIRGAATPDAAIARQREIVDAFFAAARSGDFEALVSVLDPDVVVRTDGGTLRERLSGVVRGAEAAASRAITYANPRAVLRPVLVNGAAGVVVMVNGKVFSVMAFTIMGDLVTSVDNLVDPERIARLDLSFLDG